MSTTTAGHNVIASLGVGTNLPVAIVVFVVLLWLGMVIARRVSARDSYALLRNVIVASVILHLLSAPLQIFVVHHYYHGVADFNLYDRQGSILADNWRSFHFTFANSNVRGFINAGSVSDYGGIIMTLVGPNQLAAFFVAAWLAFVGSVFFYKAFSVTFPGTDRRFYAWLIFLFPSLLFWTADVGKESIMMFGLGLTAYGMAIVLAGINRGYFYVLIGGAIGIVIRPNELVLLVGGFAIAMVVRTLVRGGQRTQVRRRGPIRTIGAFIFVAAAVVITGIAARHLIHPLTNEHGGLGTALTQLNQNNGVSTGAGSSGVPYSPNPLYFPRDVYTLLFDPFWFNARGITMIISSIENTLIFVVLIYSLRRVRNLFRVCAQRPYVLMALFYCLGFFYAFAALGNLGLITRERTLVFPLLFTILAIPIARPGERPYPWQVRRGKHKKTRLGPGPDERAPTEPVVHTTVTAQWESRFSDGAQADWSSSGWGADI